MQVVGMDIGGANLKLADREGRTVTRDFALWRYPDRLAAELERLIAEFSRPDLIAVTMTGELADCFLTKADGVDWILGAVERAAGNVPVQVWQTGAEFVSPGTAREIPLLVAAANWHALATWVGRMVPAGAAVLIDIGSTTADLIPLWQGAPIPQGLTDRDRLQSGELVYAGVRRTPVCAIASRVSFRDGECPLAAELFATTLDVYLLTGDLAEDPSNLDTANGQPTTREAAHDRLARMLCSDRTEVTRPEAEAIAGWLAERQLERYACALEQVLATLPEPCANVLISGSGAFLARRLVQRSERLRAAELHDLSRMFTPDLATAACAFAVARLAAENAM